MKTPNRMQLPAVTNTNMSEKPASNNASVNEPAQSKFLNEWITVTFSVNGINNKIEIAAKIAGIK